jgi:hypothetical protein
MTSVVNSTADDEDAHPWDDPLTTDIDESIDGVCKDNSNRCTLRAALEEAANRGEAANVTFSVSGTIDAQSAFAPPSDSYIAGEDQKITIRGKGPGEYSVLMVLDSLTWVQGLVFRDAWDGIIVAGRKNVIGGEHNIYSNVFLGMKQSGINIVGDSNVVLGNYIGIDPGGNVDGNYWGVFITGANNKIGHSDTSLSNTISGNIQGINVTGDIVGRGRDNHIVGNFIGTDPSGTQKRGNAVGVQITDAIGTQIGDYIDIPPNTSRNVISGNTESGILVGIMTSDINISTSAYIENNIIGLDVTKQNNLGNRDGIVLGPGSRKVEVRYNTITGNDSNGVVITGFSNSVFDFSSTGHKIVHNEITGNGALFSGANTGNGIAISGNAYDNIIGDELQDVFHNDGNLIVANHGSGVRITEALGVQPHSNSIRENVFSAHRFKGINIVNAQDGIQPPVITSAAMGPSIGRVTGTHGRVGARIDIYEAGSSGYSNYFEGVRYLTGDLVQSDGTFSFNIPPCNCSRVIATATDIAWNTSEFSNALQLNTTRNRRFRRGANSVSMSGSGSSSPSSSIPGASGSAYSWSGGSYPLMRRNADKINGSGSYVAVDTLVSGVGYWIKCNSEASDSVTEFLQIKDTVDVVPGWNFIGSISSPVPVAQIISIPEGMITSQFFGYDTSYFVTDTIQPGYAYWVKVNKPGSLVLAIYDTVPSSGFITIVPDTALPPPPPDQILGVEDTRHPLTFFLRNAYPNPFNPSTTIEFGIVKAGHASLKIYDILGREMTTLVNEHMQPGTYRRTWNAGNMPSGVYYYRLAVTSLSGSASSFSGVKKMLLVK